MSKGINWYSAPKHIRGCWVNGGTVPTKACPKCNTEDPPSVHKYYAALMRVDRGSRR